MTYYVLLNDYLTNYDTRLEQFNRQKRRHFYS